MKITVSQLRKIIAEEVKRATLNEMPVGKDAEQALMMLRDETVGSKPIVTIYPDNTGSDVDEVELEKSALPKVEIDANRCIFNEPKSKMNQAASKIKIKSIKNAIEMGDELPPIVVTPRGNEYLIVDGHHRYTAYKQLKKDKIPAIIVPPERVIYSDAYWQE